MLALVDAYYRFMWADVGSNGCCSEAQIFNECRPSVMGGTMGFPNADPLPDDTRGMPYFIVADDTFALKTLLMKPFSGRNLNDQHLGIFNYRLSIARLVVNVFGILVNCFKCLLTTMAKEPHNAMLVVLTCVTLHNIIRKGYWADHQGLTDEEENNHRQVPGGKVMFSQTLANHSGCTRPQLQLRGRDST